MLAYLALFALLLSSLTTQICSAQTCGVGVYPTTSPATGTCETYDPYLDDGSLGFCNGVVNYPYYLPTGMTRLQLEQAALAAITKGDPAAGIFLSVLPDRCAAQVKRAVCLATFQACEYLDPYFVDPAVCPQGDACVACGDVTSFPPQLFGPAVVSPSYGSACSNTAPSLNASACIVGPGKVPGMGNLGWELARNLSAPTMTMTQFCGAKKLVWSDDLKSCLAAVPRSPCKSECDKLWNMDRSVGLAPSGLPYLVNATCPLVSGNWTDLLTLLLASPDPFVQAQAQYALQTNTSGITSIPLTLAMGMAQDCNARAPPTNETYVFSNQFTAEFVAASRALSVGAIITLQATMQSVPTAKCHCVRNRVIANPTLMEDTNEHCASAKSSLYCTELTSTTAKCFQGGGVAPPNAGVRVVDVNDEGLVHPTCKEVIRGDENQPPAAVLQMVQLAFGLPSTDAAKGAFFVPPLPGLPPLASGKMNATARPLCAIPDARMNGIIYRGGDSFECATAAVKAAEGVIPPFVGGKCRAAYLDMLCGQAHMKLEFKTLCLLPNNAPCAPSDVQGAATNAVPFSFALPRFPSRSICDAFKTECAAFIDQQIGTLGTPQRMVFEQTFNCSGQVSQSCASNNPMDQWTSAVWPCQSPLQGLASFPVAQQPIAASLATLLGPYALANGLTNLAGLVVTDVVQPTISAATSTFSTCECPSPLEVPEDPLSSTIQPGICCQQRCEGHAFSDENYAQIGLAQRVISTLSFILSSFVLATWITAKSKRSQKFLFLFTFASWNASVALMAGAWAGPDIRTIGCKDRTTPMEQSDGGICLFQGIWLIYWVLCACCFWLVQALDLYLRVVKGRRSLDHMNKYYYVLSWGLPLVLLVIVAGFNMFGYERGQIWCLLSSEQDPNLKKALDLGMFYGVLTAMWVGGVVIMLLVIVQMIKVTGRAANIQATDGSTLAKRCNLYRTPVLFVFFFFYIWLSLISYRFDLAAKEDSIEQGAQDWVMCLLTNFASGIADPATSPLANNSVLVAKYGAEPETGCGELYPVRPTFSALMYVLCIAYLQGTFVFLIFGMRWEMIAIWKDNVGKVSKKVQGSSTTKSSAAKDPRVETHSPHMGKTAQGSVVGMFSSFSAPIASKKVGFEVENPASTRSINGGGGHGSGNEPEIVSNPGKDLWIYHEDDGTHRESHG